MNFLLNQPLVYCVGISLAPRRVSCAHLYRRQHLRFFHLHHLFCRRLALHHHLASVVLRHRRGFCRVCLAADDRLFCLRAHAYYSLINILFGLFAIFFCLPFNHRTGVFSRTVLVASASTKTTLSGLIAALLLLRLALSQVSQLVVQVLTAAARLTSVVATSRRLTLILVAGPRLVALIPRQVVALSVILTSTVTTSALIRAVVLLVSAATTLRAFPSAVVVVAPVRSLAITFTLAVATSTRCAPAAEATLVTTSSAALIFILTISLISITTSVVSIL